MKYKILCSDLDGTLLSTKSDVSESTISEINKIKSAVRTILVSARMPRGMRYLQRRLGIEEQPIICYNGALIIDGDEIITSTEIAIDHVKEIFAMANVRQIKLGLYHNDEWYVEENTERVRKEIRYTQATPVFRDTEASILDWSNRGLGAHKIMLMGTKDTSDAIYPELEERFSKDLNLYRSNDTLIEIAPKSVSKLTAIQKLLQENETMEDVISFGDNYNDVEMIQYSGYGVAVGNAREEVKAVSNFVTLPNTEDGVAVFLKEHPLV
ncbi:Cof-type HAD-IIB family hydrolase [Euzebyella saccharophila]|uniref:Cof-type HAD-IIB family hydrolase n=1 Tax=Euzebyella saccharophila TaxID=679664 RepID=A0ABV8JLX3_9FLAO|nr:Cof-type HAD-IIB family hydrolase [Euzebyella saccharophila]